MRIDIVVRGIAMAAVTLLLGACASTGGSGTGGIINQNPAALHGNYSGNDFSGAVAFVPDASNIPGVPESNGRQPVWTEKSREQALYIDAFCQKELFKWLPKPAQNYIKEMGWGAFWTAVGEGLFSSAFPGTVFHQYAQGGAGYGAAAYANNERIRRDASVKSFQGYCTVVKVWRAQQDYPGKVLPGFDAIPWYGSGSTAVPVAEKAPPGTKPFRRPGPDGRPPMPPPQ